MFNPNELEGEVDHSFFDSDVDDGSLSRHRGKQMESPPQAHESLHATQAEKTKEDLSPRTDGTKQHLRKVNRNMNRGEREESRHQSNEEARSRSSNLSSVASGKVSNSSDSENDYKLHSNRALLALLAEPNPSPSPNETEEETPPSTAKHTGSKYRNRQLAKKLKRNVCAKSPSQSSAKASVETDSESCSSSISGRSSGSPTFPKSKKSFSSPRKGRAREASRDLSTSHSEGSESVTDVSPLSSPDISPLQSMDLNHRGSEEGNSKEQQREQDSVPSSGLSDIHHDENSDQTADEFSMNSESRPGSKLVFHHPGGKNRKNYSFTNDEVRRIDQENQRLLRALSRLSVGSRPASAVGKKTSKVGKSPVSHLAPSALNRQREQKRIERENLAFLKRLESVKPTSGMRRSDQLADYQRQVGYLEAPTHPMCWSPSRIDRSIHRKNTGPRSASSSHHSSRAISATTASRITPAPK